MLLAFSFSQITAFAQTKKQEPRIITEMDVKKHWVKKFPIPRKLASNYHEQKRNYKKLIENIKAGKYDYDAKVKALEWNIKEYQRVRDFEMANQARKDLARVQQVEAERKRRENARATEHALLRLEWHLRNIEFELRGY